MSGSILIVSCDQTVPLAEAALRDAGFEVATASTLAEALRCTDAEMPDLLVVDEEWQEEGPWAFLRELMKNPAARDLPMVWLRVKDPPMGLSSAGIVDPLNDLWLVKPFELLQLVEAVKRTLEFHADQRSMDTLPPDLAALVESVRRSLESERDPGSLAQ